MAGRAAIHAGLVVSGIALLSGCAGIELPELPGFLSRGGGGEVSETTTTRLVERDVEAPEVFQKTENGLWDGRPSLGGVWVAHPDVTDPERVIIRNTENGSFVIGALFRREREVPGPRFQVSSDAAAAFGMLAGQPAELNVTALRREELPETDAQAGGPAARPDPDDPIAAAAAALDAAEGVAPPPRPEAPAATLAKPFVQVGIFSVEANAQAAVAKLARAGIQATTRPGSSAGKRFWRVIVGPATSAAELARLLETIKDQGFPDAYFVTN